jgi:hypothetical protein
MATKKGSWELLSVKAYVLTNTHTRTHTHIHTYTHTHTHLAKAQKVSQPVPEVTEGGVQITDLSVCACMRA